MIIGKLNILLVLLLYFILNLIIVLAKVVSSDLSECENCLADINLD